MPTRLEIGELLRGTRRARVAARSRTAYLTPMRCRELRQHYHGTRELAVAGVAPGKTRGFAANGT